MLTIRLSRAGRTKYPTYRVVAAESARAATGKFVAVLGHYNPHTKDLVLEHDAIKKHLSHGAQPSNTVIKLLQREKIELPAWVKLETKHRQPKKVAEPKPEPTAEATPAAPSDEAPSAEATAAPTETETPGTPAESPEAQE